MQKNILRSVPYTALNANFGVLVWDYQNLECIGVSERLADHLGLSLESLLLSTPEGHPLIEILKKISFCKDEEDFSFCDGQVLFLPNGNIIEIEIQKNYKYYEVITVLLPLEKALQKHKVVSFLFEPSKTIENIAEKIYAFLEKTFYDFNVILDISYGGDCIGSFTNIDSYNDHVDIKSFAKDVSLNKNHSNLFFVSHKQMKEQQQLFMKAPHGDMPYEFNEEISKYLYGSSEQARFERLFAKNNHNLFYYSAAENYEITILISSDTQPLHRLGYYRYIDQLVSFSFENIEKKYCELNIEKNKEKIDFIKIMAYSYRKDFFSLIIKIKDDILSVFDADIIQANINNQNIILKSKYFYDAKDEDVSCHDFVMSKISSYDDVFIRENISHNYSKTENIDKNILKYDRFFVSYLEEDIKCYLFVGRLKENNERNAWRDPCHKEESWYSEIYYQWIKETISILKNNMVGSFLNKKIDNFENKYTDNSSIVKFYDGNEYDIMDQYPDIIFIVDADNRLLYFNNKFLSVCKNKTIELQDEIHECLVSNFSSSFIELVNRHHKEKNDIRQIVHLTDKFGQNRRIEFFLKAIERGEGSVQECVVRGIDVGHIQMGQQELETACEVAGFGYWEYHPASRQMICNDHAANIMNWDSRSFIGGLQGLLRNVHEIDRQSLHHILTDKRWITTASEIRVYDARGDIRYIQIDAQRQKAKTKAQPSDPQLVGEEGGKSAAEKTLILIPDERIFAIVQDVTTRKQAALSLAQSEARLKEAQRMAHQGYFEYSLDTERLHWSEDTFTIWGRDQNRDILSFETIESWIHPEDRAQARRDRLDERWTEKTCVYRIVRPSGEIRYIVMRMFREKDAEGQSNRLFGLQQDITELKNSEYALRANALRLKEAQQIGRIGHWESNLRRRTVWWSDIVYELHGLPTPSEPDELLRERRIEINHYLKYIDKRDRSTFRRYWTDVLDGGEASAEYRYYHAETGETRWLRTACRIEHDSEGIPLRAAGILQDVTESRNAAEALRESRNWFRDLAACSSDLFWQSDEAGDFTSLTGAGLSHLRKHLEHQSWLSLEQLAEKQIGHALPHRITDAIAQKVQFKNIDLPVHLTGEGLQWLRISGVPQFNSDGAFTGYRGAITDNTASHLATERDAQQGKLVALGQLAGGVAHEINNQLQPILILSEVSLSKLEGHPDHKTLHKCLETIRNSAENARNIVRNTLTFARKEMAENRPMETEKTVIKVISLLRQTLPHTVLITDTLDAEGVLTCTNETQLTQILMNLVKNATDAMENDGTINISLSVTSPPSSLDQLEQGRFYLCLSVVDTGSGMTTEVKARALDPFYTTKPVGEGTGLGLPSVYGIVKAWSGDMQIESALGKGTAIKLYIPLLNRDECKGLPLQESDS